MQAIKAKKWARAYAQVWVSWFDDPQEAWEGLASLKIALQQVKNLREMLPVFACDWRQEHQAWSAGISSPLKERFARIWTDWVRTRRLQLFPLWTEAVEQLLCEKEGKWLVTVRCANELAPALKLRFEEGLVRKLGPLRCHWELDEELKAGYQICAQGWVLDCSGAHFLRQFKNHLAGLTSSSHDLEKQHVHR